MYQLKEKIGLIEVEVSWILLNVHSV